LKKDKRAYGEPSGKRKRKAKPKYVEVDQSEADESPDEPTRTKTKGKAKEPDTSGQEDDDTEKERGKVGKGKGKGKETSTDKGKNVNSRSKGKGKSKEIISSSEEDSTSEELPIVTTWGPLGVAKKKSKNCGALAQSTQSAHPEQPGVSRVSADPSHDRTHALAVQRPSRVRFAWEATSSQRPQNNASVDVSKGPPHPLSPAVRLTSESRFLYLSGLAGNQTYWDLNQLLDKVG